MEISPDSASGTTGFRCASGAENFNVDELSRKRLENIDQEVLQKITQEGGTEALQEFLKESGVKAQVMTPEELDKKRQRLQELKAKVKEQKKTNGREL
jgi:tetrahydromethanopterin S-methyltransferase subunit G